MKLKRSETFFKGYDGTQLYLQKWEPQHPTIGTILITHGQAEHSDAYLRLIEGLYKLNPSFPFQFIGWDLRGHGQSSGIRGYAQDFDDYVLDFHLFLEFAQTLFPKNHKQILLAHSMGCLIQSCAIKEKKLDRESLQILSAPLFGLSAKVPEWKEKGSTIINKVLPKLTLSNELNNEQLTRDPEVIREYEKDTYRHNKISSGVFLGFKREFNRVLELAESCSLPTLLQVSDHDPIVSSSKALEYFEHIKTEQKSLKVYNMAKHEIYNDIIRENAYQDIIDFLKKYVS